jgi:hypothetical protein
MRSGNNNVIRKHKRRALNFLSELNIVFPFMKRNKKTPRYGKRDFNK